MATDSKLLTEHFGYPPVALIDDIINAVNVLADRALDSVESLLLSLPPSKLGFPPLANHTPDHDSARRAIEHGTHQLETLLNAAIDRNFDLFELYTMRNILAVSPQDQPWVRLAHYEGLDFAAEGGTTSASLCRARRLLHASQRLGLALETERLRNDALLDKLRRVAGFDADSLPTKPDPDSTTPQPLAFLSHKHPLALSATAHRPMATTAEFAASQVPALRSLSNSLHSLLPALSRLDSSAAQDSTPDAAAAAASSSSARRQRAQYVEASARTYLQRARGLELGAQGDVRDGEWQGPGRPIGKHEVEELENLAAALRRGAEPGASLQAESKGGPAVDDAMQE
ncbi:hypothetical protein CDD81_752 [Ophiocordyceps australis]|uniref:Mis12 domain-containing protein n=1 Tax=Ophiocordyceps australis TaxID=1399860 RepID=A0A2C5XV36_9HYPO|nr:hypothetical protein CDD81_752 [Ophiocordyceps australis]